MKTEEAKVEEDYIKGKVATEPLTINEQSASQPQGGKITNKKN